MEIINSLSKAQAECSCPLSPALLHSLSVSQIDGRGNQAHSQGPSPLPPAPPWMSQQHLMINRPPIGMLRKLEQEELSQVNTEGCAVSLTGSRGFLDALPGQTALREGKHKHANEGPLGTPITSQRISMKCNTQLSLYSLLELIQINCTAAKSFGSLKGSRYFFQLTLLTTSYSINKSQVFFPTEHLFLLHECLFYPIVSLD